MLIKRVVINSSPLIVLFKIEQADLLPQLFSEIVVPGGVWDEITAADKNDPASRQLSRVTWAQRVEISNVAPEVAAWDLGKGESEVLSFALKNSEFAAIIDDRAARRCSQALGMITKSVNAGDRFVEAFSKKCQHLAQFPYLGRAYSEFAPGLRGVPLMG